MSYSEGNEEWEKGDIRVESITDEAVICSTPHLTDFGVLLGGAGGGDNGAGGGGAGAGSGGWTLVEILSVAFGAGAVLIVAAAVVTGHVYLRQRTMKRFKQLDNLNAKYLESHSVSAKEAQL